MNNKKNLLVTMLLLLPAAAAAQDAGMFLKLPMSARGSGMGDAYAAGSGDPMGLHYNPASLASLKAPAASLTHHVYLQDISGDSLAGGLRLGNYAFGAAPTFFSMKEEKIYDGAGNDTGETFGYEGKVLPFGAARSFGPLDLGAALKYYTEKIGEDSSGSQALDFGAVYSFDKLRLGAALQNLGGKVFDYDMARVMRLGAAYGGKSYTAAADLVKEGSQAAFVNAGGEYCLTDALRLRAGLRLREEFGGATFGLGFKFRGLGLDYAYVGYGDLGDTHKMALSYGFGAGEKKYTPPIPQAAKAQPKPNGAPALAWTGEENYAQGGVNPASGNTAMSFVFRVKYSDPDNDAPARGYPKLHIRRGVAEISGSPFAMEYVSGENSGGAVYAYSKALPAGNDYSYSFEARDRAGAEAAGAPATPVSGPVVAQAEEKKMQGGINVAVAEFTGKNVSQADASIVADFLRTGLVGTGLFNVMDRDNMDTVLSEQKFQNSGCTEQQCAVEMGKLLNVKQMLVGSLSKLLDTYYITVNVIDVETGKIIASYDGDAGNARELKEACQRIVRKITGK